MSNKSSNLGSILEPIRLSIFIRNLEDETKNANNAKSSGIVDTARAELQFRGLLPSEP